MQLNMGEGKSSVIVPIVAAALADGSRVVRVLVAKSQSKQMLQMLMSKLGGLLDRVVYPGSKKAVSSSVTILGLAVSRVSSWLCPAFFDEGRVSGTTCPLILSRVCARVFMKAVSIFLRGMLSAAPGKVRWRRPLVPVTA